MPSLIGCIVGATLLVMVLSRVVGYLVFKGPNKQKNAALAGVVGTIIACVAAAIIGLVNPVVYVIGGVVYIPIAVLLAGRKQTGKGGETGVLLVLLVTTFCGCADACHGLKCSKDYFACLASSDTTESECHTLYKQCKE